MKVSDVASIAGVSPSTLRLWEKHGLVEPERTPSGHRYYNEESLARIRDIARLRSVQGLNFAAIKQVLGDERSDVHAVTQPLGARLRQLRESKQLTLRDVAALTGLAHSFISVLERTSGGASMTSLKKLAECYGTSVTALIEEAAGPAKNLVMRSKDSRVAPVLGPSIFIEQLSNHLEHLDCQRWRIAPGASSDGSYDHDGEEFLFVLQGRFEISIEGYGKYKLQAGDSVAFPSTNPHSWRNPGKEEAIVIWVNTPPTF